MEATGVWVIGFAAGVALAIVVQVLRTKARKHAREECPECMVLRERITALRGIVNARVPGDGVS